MARIEAPCVGKSNGQGNTPSPTARLALIAAGGSHAHSQREGRDTVIEGRMPQTGHVDSVEDGIAAGVVNRSGPGRAAVEDLSRVLPRLLGELRSGTRTVGRSAERGRI